MKEELSAAKVFSSISVFDLLRNQLHLVFWIVSSVLSGKVSLDRMNDFLHNVGISPLNTKQPLTPTNRQSFLTNLIPGPRTPISLNLQRLFPMRAACPHRLYCHQTLPSFLLTLPSGGLVSKMLHLLGRVIQTMALSHQGRGTFC